MTGDALTSGQRAVAARRAISVYALARHRLEGTFIRDSARSDHDPEQERLSHLLCALRHHADHLSTLSFHYVLTAAGHNSDRRDPHNVPVSPARAAAAAHAIDAYEASSAAPGQYHASAWPVDALANLRIYADRKDISFEMAVADLTTALVIGLRHYADRNGLEFEAALTASTQAYTEQRLREEGPFKTGQDPHSRPATLLTPAPAAPLFGPIATHQGIVTSFDDAEWHLVRTAGRIRDRERRGFQGTYLPDLDDRRALADALSAACGMPASVILRRLAARIEARAQEIEHGVIAAAELGRVHGRDGAEPSCALDMDGDDSALMRALGETEWSTDASHWHRLALIDAYTEAYQHASTRNAGPAMSPARLAARDFPSRSGTPAPPTSPAAPPVSGSKARTARAAQPWHGPRRHAR